MSPLVVIRTLVHASDSVERQNPGLAKYYRGPVWASFLAKLFNFEP
jgi:hypothetical protein